MGRSRNKRLRNKKKSQSLESAANEANSANLKEDPPRRSYNDIVKANANFEKFYKMQGIIPPEEWETFMAILKEHLPATFRITGYKGQAKALLNIIKGKYFNDLLNAKLQAINKCAPFCLPWYPGNLAWQMNLSRVIIRSSEELCQLHNFLVSETETGNISRQETVSMIPPLLLNVEPHHKVLDMCAAPGSKTAQIIEFLHRDEGKVPDGLLVANDIDNKRCYMLVHQAKRLNSPCSIITNHDAANLPNLKIMKDGKRINLKYDRILCDVPCSGDGTLRKTYDIWEKWNTANANNLHGLQLRILKRGLELLATGGRIVYSTCSFNPVENEAVVSAVLQQTEGCCELLDVSSMLPGLKTCPGLSEWKIANKEIEVFEKFEDVPDKNLKQIRPHMFPPSPEVAAKLNLSRCLRLLPHHQDTGGFFVAVIQKNMDRLPWEKSCKGEVEGGVENSPPRKKRKVWGYKEDPFVFLEETEEAWPIMRDFYKLKDFPVQQLLCRCKKNRKRNLYFVSESVKNIVQENAEEVKIINTGVRMFSRSENKDAKCPFRLTQEGIPTVMPFLNNRIVEVNLEDLILLLTDEYPSNDLFSNDVKGRLSGIESGCVVLIYTGNKGADDEFNIELTGWKGNKTLRCYVPKIGRAHYLRICGVDVSEYEKRDKKKFKIKEAEEACDLDNTENIAEPIASAIISTEEVQKPQVKESESNITSPNSTSNSNVALEVKS